MKKLPVLLLLIGVLFSCSKDDGIEIIEQNYLIFGHFYGECIGEGCIETFKLTQNALYEDISDDYAMENPDFVALNASKFEQAKDIVNFFPNELLNNNETSIGCPDCADGGGLYISYAENGNVRSWRIDQIKENVPNYLHNFIDKVNEKIRLIND